MEARENGEPTFPIYEFDTIEVGDEVVFPEYAGMDYRIDENLMFIKQEDIVAVI